MALASERQELIEFLLRRSPALFLLGMAYAGGVCLLTPVPLDMLLWLVAAGAATAVLVALSLRFYHFWLSWLIWAVPAPAMVGSVVAARVSEGVMHPTFAVVLGMGVALAVTFGLFWLLRSQLRGWLR